MRLRGRLLASFTYLLLLAVLALAVPLGVNVQRRARADLEAEVAGQALVIAASIPELIADQRPAADLVATVASYAQDIEARVIVVDGDGTLLADSESAGAPAPSAYGNRPEVARALAGERVLEDRFSDDLGLRLLVVAAPVLRGGRVVGAVRLSQPTEAVDRRVRLTWVAIALAGSFVLVVGSVVAFALARSLSRPLGGLHETAARLAGGDLSARASEHGPRDVAEVARALNRMAEDLERSVAAQRDFVANASHQLRTPLTGLRLRLESIERAGGPRAADAAAAIAEIDRLNGLVEDLLRLARARAGGATQERIDLGDLAHDAAERWTVRAAQLGQTVELTTAAAMTTAGREDLAMALDNLIENAVAYAGAGARIAITARAEDGRAVLRVTDDGPGIPSEDLSRVRERFYRGRHGSAAGPGTGLGLAIVDEIVSRWGGELTISSDDGTIATIRLPLTET